jgi:hypothetical protein
VLSWIIRTLLEPTDRVRRYRCRVTLTDPPTGVPVAGDGEEVVLVVQLVAPES